MKKKNKYLLFIGGLVFIVAIIIILTLLMSKDKLLPVITDTEPEPGVDRLQFIYSDQKPVDSDVVIWLYPDADPDTEEIIALISDENGVIEYKPEQHGSNIEERSFRVKGLPDGYSVAFADELIPIGKECDLTILIETFEELTNRYEKVGEELEIGDLSFG